MKSGQRSEIWAPPKRHEAGGSCAHLREIKQGKKSGWRGELGARSCHSARSIKSKLHSEYCQEPPAENRLRKRKQMSVRQSRPQRGLGLDTSMGRRPQLGPSSSRCEVSGVRCSREAPRPTCTRSLSLPSPPLPCAARTHARTLSAADLQLSTMRNGRRDLGASGPRVCGCFLRDREEGREGVSGMAASRWQTTTGRKEPQSADSSRKWGVGFKEKAGGRADDVPRSL